ncbi:MAG: NAD(P)-binding domain-containing protein [Deltaproteobacteria bacterium]|nr:NAD(P)-binding domain-containing protein [Deltaproteobacteria bacterium]
MKIAFVMSDRPDYVARIPKDLDWFPAAPDADGHYSQEVLASLAPAEAIICAHNPITEAVLAAAPRLKMVQRMGVGYNAVDIEAARRRNLPVCNLGDVNKDALAEHGMMFMLALARRVVPAHALTAAGDWFAARRVLDDTFELMGRTLGVLGFGRSGYELARRARAFGMHIRYHSRSEPDARLTEAVQAQGRSFEALLAESDFLAVCVSLNDSTRNLLDARALARMKPGACLINLARGGIVDEAALAQALREGRLGGAGMDVFAQEPPQAGNPLATAPHVVMTPHGAGTTRECTDREIAWSLENVRRYLVQGLPPRWIVNGVQVGG